MGSKVARFTAKQLLGLDQNWVGRAGSASVLDNWRWESRGGWETVGGFEPLLEPETPPSPRYTGSSVIYSIHWFSRHNGAQQFLLYEDGDNLRVFNGSGTQGWDTLQTGRYTSNSPWQRTQYAAWGGWCFIINGKDEPVRYDGRKLVRCGFDRAPSGAKAYGRDDGYVENTSVIGLGLGPTTTGTAGEDADARYRYFVTFVNELGVESPPSSSSPEVSWTAAGGTAGTRVMAALALPPGADTVAARRIYRTKNYDGEPETTGSTFYFLREIRNNRSDLFIDAVPDERLGQQYSRSEFGPWPRSAKYISFFKGGCFLAGMSEYTDRVVYSRAGQPENFPADNFIPVGDVDSGEITGMYPTTNALVVFKRRGVYLIKGDYTNGFFAATLTEDTGCHAPNSIREIPGLGLAFASDAGVHVLVGALEEGTQATRIENISDNMIPDYWADVAANNLMSAHAGMEHQDHEYWLAVPTVGQPEPTTILVYHYDTGQWSRRTGIPSNCMAETRDHRGYLFFGSHDKTSHPGIHAWCRGWPDYDGDSVTSTYETSWIDFGKLYESVTVNAVILYVIGYADSISVDYYTERGVKALRAYHNDGAASKDADVPDDLTSPNTMTKWGDGTWGDGETAGKWRPVLIRFDVDTYYGSVSEFKFKVEAAGRCQIVNWAVDVTANGPRDVRPLNTDISPSVT